MKDRQLRRFLGIHIKPNSSYELCSCECGEGELSKVRKDIKSVEYYMDRLNERLLILEEKVEEPSTNTN